MLRDICELADRPDLVLALNEGLVHDEGADDKAITADSYVFAGSR